MIFADGVVAAHDLVGLNGAETNSADQAVFNGLREGRGTQRARGANGGGYGDVGRFDAVFDAEGIQPLQIVTAHVCGFEPVVCVHRDVFAVAVSFGCHVARAPWHVGCVSWGLRGIRATLKDEE